ncbi:MAG TPA: enoyl-CoA hydratase-related protein [Acidimicrobiia bacterium]|nr:enoyl-CoA hydratase-related protein [Acidimicrobiia bacterium]
MDPNDSRVTLERDGNVAVVTLDDPARRNALSLEVTVQLGQALEEAGADPSIGALVLTATPPAFCAGGSVDDLLNPRASLRDMYAGVLALSRLTLPSIAAVNGPVIGAGVNLPLACDVILASPKARFDPRFMDLGIHPGGGHLWRLERLVGRQAAAALVLFGESLSGEEAARVGLAWRCVDDDELLDAAIALARRAADRPRELVGRAKAVLDSSPALDTWEEAFELEYGHQEWSMEQSAFQDRLAQLRAKLEKD